MIRDKRGVAVRARATFKEEVAVQMTMAVVGRTE